MRTRIASCALALLALGCRHKPSDKVAVNNITVSPGAEFTVLRANFPRAEDLVFHDASCTGVRLHEGREPDSLPGGRVNVWIARGDVVGHVERNRDGVYQAQVRGGLPHGARVVAELLGSTEVQGHRFRAWAEVPSAVTPTAPPEGFSQHAGAPMELRWAGGDSSHVSVVVMVTVGDRGSEGYILGCVAPRAAGKFVVPAAALARGLIPEGADRVSVAVTADNRVTEDEYALDVTPLGTNADLVNGRFVR